MHADKITSDIAISVMRLHDRPKQRLLQNVFLPIEPSMMRQEKELYFSETRFHMS